LEDLVKLREVKNPVLDAAKIAVSKQVILFVCVKWSGENRSHDRLSVPSAEERYDLVAVA
jgi:hypothetical protein